MRPNVACTSEAEKAGTSAESSYAAKAAGSELDSPDPNKPRK